ncbi:MAG: amino acid ABC transporter ATP-binding protein, partial [Jatrophihabitantaceae bacterium]
YAGDRRCCVQPSLAVEPDVVLADELTAELDHEWKHRVLDVVLDVARRGGVVVLATHDLDVAARCDRVIHLDSGHVHPDNPPL